LDAESLKSAELVCKEWLRVISEGMLWKKLIERKVRTDSLWRGLAERRNWMQYLFKPRPGQTQRPHSFHRELFPKIMNVSGLRSVPIAISKLILLFMVSAYEEVCGASYDSLCNCQTASH